MWPKLAKAFILCLAVTASLAFNVAAGRAAGPSTPKYEILTETVPYTGVTHLVMLTGRGLFPQRTYAEPGDRILFVNMTNSSLSATASKSVWRTGTLPKFVGYVMFVQDGMERQFTAATFSSSSGASGEIIVNQTPAAVDFPQSAVPIANLISMLKLPDNLLHDALYVIGQAQLAAGITDGVLSTLN